MTRVLVCGGRTFGIVLPDTPPEMLETERARAEGERRLLATALTPYLGDAGLHTIIHGAAPGADAHAARWAERHGVPALAFPANWKKHKGAAGPIRNRKMLAEGRPDIVIAFKGGRGTANMVDQARAAGVQVVEVKA
jgi:predicted Rossmann-fold nucleotide-binding protein